jgi:hypothetical protein
MRRVLPWGRLATPIQDSTPKNQPRGQLPASPPSRSSRTEQPARDLHLNELRRLLAERFDPAELDFLVAADARR